jgi:WD40 repeat protein
LREISSRCGHINSIKYFPNGKYFAVGYGGPGNFFDDPGTIEIWEAQSLKMATRFKAHKRWVKALAVSPDGKLFASGSQDKEVKLWNVSGFK